MNASRFVALLSRNPYDPRPVYNFGANLLTSPEQFDALPWASTSVVTVTADSTVAPDGTTTADTLSKAGGTDCIRYQYLNGLLPNARYMASIFILKDADTTRFPEFYLRLSNGANEQYVQVNTSTGQLAVRSSTGAPPAPVIVSAGNYWKLFISGTTTSNVVNDVCVFGIRPAVSGVLGSVDLAAAGAVIVARAYVHKR